MHFLRRIWERMQAIYGHKFLSAWGDSPQHPMLLPDGSRNRMGGKLTVAGDTWAKGLAGIDPQQLGRGLEACITRADPWPPTLPEFRALCLGVPSLLQVRQEILRKAPPTPFGRAVWASLDSWTLRQANQRDADRLIQQAYEDVREAVMRGERLPDPPSGELEAPRAPSPAPHDPARVRACMEQLSAALGLQEPPDEATGAEQA